MHAEPVYNGVPYPPRPPAAPTGPAALPGVPAGAALPRMVGHGAVPQVRIDYRAAQEIKRIVVDQLLKEKKNNPSLAGEAEEQRGRALINEQVAIWADATGRGGGYSPIEEQELAGLAFDMCFRAGRLQRYLDDDLVEDIWIEGPHQVFLKYSDDAEPVQVTPVADSEEELQELVRDLIRASGQSGRTFSTFSPEVELRLKDGSRVQALGPEVTGEFTHVAIRRHRLKDADLAQMVSLGALDEQMADFLRACIRARRNIIFAGEQSSGKTSMLRAVLREIPASERFGTLETTFELWAHKNGYHQHVVPMEARASNGERVDGRAAGEITLLDLLKSAKRMSLTRVVVGEVRGEEITAMMQAMTSDRPGNMCTIHASEPEAVFDRIAELYLLAQSNFTPELAYRQIANGLHFVVFLSVDESGPVKRRFVSHIWEVKPVGPDGRPTYNEIYRPASEWDQRAVPYAPLSVRNRQRLQAAGLRMDLVAQPSAWPHEVGA
ncbi:CpaF/VirB11 family protein [Streptomyces mauvecolor]|uniref:CpaF/VirB11 family protein n=1 Tax=Streptomyces mauvecolor TaxID=58345 RepID=A0ABV9UGL0_9ACTN